MTPLYAYGVVRAEPARELGSGVGDAPVEAIAGSGVAVVVSDATRVGQHARREDLRRHSEVLQRVLEHGPVLPFHVGTVFEGRDELEREFLLPRAGDLGALLDEYENTVELVVKATYRDEDVLLREVVEQHDEIARLREATRAAPEAASYYDRIRLGELVSAAVEGRRADDERWLVGRFEGLALATSVEDGVSAPRVTKTAFLVRRGDVAAFENAAEDAARESAERLSVKLLGPLPPYSFVAATSESLAGAR